MLSTKISLVALVSVFALAIDGIVASPFAVGRETITLPVNIGHSNAARFGSINTVHRMPGSLLGIPINAAKNLSITSSNGDGVPITDHQLAALPNKAVISAVGSPVMADTSTSSLDADANGHSQTTSTSSTYASLVSDDDDVPIPEYDDPGYRIKCINSTPDDEPGSTHEDFKEAFECWFYHRTRCFSGDLTSLDPKCKHDCVCEKNDWNSYDGATKGNKGAGMGGVCGSKPNPHYSSEDGGCA